MREKNIFNFWIFFVFVFAFKSKLFGLSFFQFFLKGIIIFLIKVILPLQSGWHRRETQSLGDSGSIFSVSLSEDLDLSFLDLFKKTNYKQPPSKIFTSLLAPFKCPTILLIKLVLS